MQEDVVADHQTRQAPLMDVEEAEVVFSTGTTCRRTRRAAAGGYLPTQTNTQGSIKNRFTNGTIRFGGALGIKPTSNEGKQVTPMIDASGEKKYTKEDNNCKFCSTLVLRQQEGHQAGEEESM